MDECFKCGISGDKAFLMEAITNEGIVKICRKCSFEEDIPTIRKPTVMQLREPEKRQTVYQRLSKVAGIKDRPVENRELKKQETTLKEIVDERFKSRIKEKKSAPEELIDNFHWVLMRVRRLKKITPEQLAEKINSSAMEIKMAERGVLGGDYLKLMKKLEDFFGIRLIKEGFRPVEKSKIEVVRHEELGKPEEIFDIQTSGDLKISDLKKMKEKHEEGIFEDNLPEEKVVFNERVRKNENEAEFVKEDIDIEEENFKEENSESKKGFKEDEDLTQDEIDRILFGR